jgi:hypothetical protein
MAAGSAARRRPALVVESRLHRAGGGALRRRLIRLLSAGWVPPSVSSSRGFPRSRGRASGSGPATELATGVPHRGSAPGTVQRG